MYSCFKATPQSSFTILNHEAFNTNLLSNGKSILTQQPSTTLEDINNTDTPIDKPTIDNVNNSTANISKMSLESFINYLQGYEVPVTTSDTMSG